MSSVNFNGGRGIDQFCLDTYIHTPSPIGLQLPTMIISLEEVFGIVISAKVDYF